MQCGKTVMGREKKMRGAVGGLTEEATLGWCGSWRVQRGAMRSSGRSRTSNVRQL